MWCVVMVGVVCGAVSFVMMVVRNEVVVWLYGALCGNDVVWYCLDIF